MTEYAVSAPVSDAEIWECVATREPERCFIFDPENQPSVQRQLDNGEVFWTRYLLNGTHLSWPGGSVPLGNDVALCRKHGAVAPEATT